MNNGVSTSEVRRSIWRGNDGDVSLKFENPSYVLISPWVQTNACECEGVQDKMPLAVYRPHSGTSQSSKTDKLWELGVSLFPTSNSTAGTESFALIVP